MYLLLWVVVVAVVIDCLGDVGGGIFLVVASSALNQFCRGLTKRDSISAEKKMEVSTFSYVLS